MAVHYKELGLVNTRDMFKKAFDELTIEESFVWLPCFFSYCLYYFLHDLYSFKVVLFSYER